ncbi:MAG: tetratricopeptide repeat protein [Bacteroidetes bacterium]|nr:tetratricopeptide repeat protein [Bacteroidota bacterium]
MVRFKNKIIFFLFLLASANLFSNTGDSLKKKYLEEKNELKKIYTSSRIISYYSSNYDSVKFYGQQLISDWKKANNKLGEAFINYRLGIEGIESSNYDDAKKNLRQAITLFNDQKNDSMSAAAHMRLGFAFYTLADYESAIKTYLSGIEKATQAKRPVSVSWGYNLMGLAFYAKPNPDYKKALYYYFKALDIDKQLKRDYLSNLLLMRIGSVYTKLKDYSNASYYLNRSLTQSDSLHDNVSKKWALEALTGLYNEKKEYQKAVDVGKSSLQMSLRVGEYPGIIISYRNIAENYILLKNFKQANINIDSAIYYSIKYSIFQTLPFIYEVKSNVMESSGMINEALFYYKRSIHLKDSLFSLQNNKNINELETKYESKEKEKEIQFLNKEKESDKKIQNILMLAFGLAIILIGMIIFALAKINGARKKLKTQNEIIEAKQKEIVDSIHYAKRIQTSLLPTEKYLEKHIKN